MHSKHNEGKFVVPERFIRTLSKLFKHMRVVSKNVHFDVLDDIAENTITHFIELLK